MQVGDRIKLSGGYDMEPKWLYGGKGYFATVLDFIENKVEKRSGDTDLSVLIEFDETIVFEGLSGKYGLLDLRWKNQIWENKGTVHAHLLKNKIQVIEEKTDEFSRWMESHATYEVIKNLARENG